LVLNNKNKLRRLGNLEKNILLIAETILEVLNTKEAPIKTICYTDDMYEALLGNNFSLALELNCEFIEQTNGVYEEDTVNILLNKLNSLISKYDNNYFSDNNVFDEIEDIYIEDDNEEIVVDESVLFDKYIFEVEEFAHYILNDNISLEDARIKHGLLPEVVLLIKLIYARDYYGVSKYADGDKLIDEVMKSSFVTPRVLYFINYLKENKNNFVVFNDVKKKTLIKE